MASACDISRTVNFEGPATAQGHYLTQSDCTRMQRWLVFEALRLNLHAGRLCGRPVCSHVWVKGTLTAFVFLAFAVEPLEDAGT